MPMDPCPLVLEVQHEPQLQAWIGNSESYLVAPSEIEHSVKVQMFIDVEDTPDFVEPPPSTPLLIPFLLALPIYCSVDQ